MREVLGGDETWCAAHGRDAPDASRPRARGERAHGARLLQLQPRVGGPGAAVARSLPEPRPDAALRLHEDGAADPAVVPTARAVGAQVPATPRATRTAHEDLP